MLKKIAMAMALMAAGTAHAAEVMVSITNLTQGISFTPLLVAAHGGSALFNAGQLASPALQKMAEGGDIADLSAALVGASKVENPAAGLLKPGMSAMATVMSSATNTHLSIVGMMLPTNDGFIALNNWAIPTMPGTYQVMLNAYDAGTEANNEIRGGGAPGVAGFPVPGPLDSEVGHNGTGIPGVTAEGYVHIHRGLLGDMDMNAGASDAQSARHRWLNPVARVTVTVK